TVTSLPGTVPFAVTFDANGDLALSEAGLNAVATFTIDAAGHLTSVDSALTGQAATCWIVSVNGKLYLSNAGSGTVSGYAVNNAGAVNSLGNTHTDGGTVDAAVSADGHNLYVQTGAAGKVDAFRIEADGALTAIGSVTVPDAVGGEG